jgi:hypothetical protein
MRMTLALSIISFSAGCVGGADLRDGGAELRDAGLDGGVLANDGGVADASEGATDAGQDASSLDSARAPRATGYAPFPVPGPMGQRYTVEGALVRDEVTGLSWERVASPVRRDLEDAHAHCDALALDGHADLRVPSRAELTTLLAPTRSPTTQDFSSHDRGSVPVRRLRLLPRSKA